MPLHGKIVVITGSTAGIGQSIAEHLASLGAHVVITSRNLKTAEREAKKIASLGGSVTCQCFKLENQNSGKELIDTVLAEHDRLDILVNNAISRPTPLSSELMHDFRYEKLHDYITNNITNILALTLRAYPHLKKTKGSVLNVGSVIIKRHILGTLLYSIVKGAMTQMTKALAAEWAQDQVRVNQINAGFVLTDSFQKQFPAEISQSLTDIYRSHHPIGRVGEPRNIGVLAGHLLSDELSWMTGSVVDMDGGYSVKGIPNPIQSLTGK
jgi:NAD(P)-dependent dehydrogenase (short-subunit alcohol dehydrogenase family)